MMRRLVAVLIAAFLLPFLLLTGRVVYFTATAAWYAQRGDTSIRAVFMLGSLSLSAEMALLISSVVSLTLLVLFTWLIYYAISRQEDASQPGLSRKARKKSR